MENVLIFVAIAFLAAILLKLFVSGGSNDNPALIDINNKITEIKVNQLEGLNKSMKDQQDAFGAIIKTVNETLSRTQGNINEQLGSAGQTMGDVQKKLGALAETTKNIQKIGEDISSLQDILQAPKLRGNLGEFMLEDLLKNLGANNYAMKYVFKNGTQADSVLKLGGKMVAIDSKFPLESFKRLIQTPDDEEKKKYKKEFIRSVKERIDEIADKYINPDEGTFDFALMYIPAENVFYEIIVNDSFSNDYEIFKYAIEKHVVPVSPNSFYAYLMAIVYGLKGFQIEKQAETILGELTKIQDKFSRFYSSFTLVGKHLGNAYSKYDESLRSAERLNERISKLTGERDELPDESETKFIDKVASGDSAV
ncbi:DNA recombination protein RmuC [bacterium]|nr:DNA recombination protein RmuC [bacterium]